MQKVFVHFVLVIGLLPAVPMLSAYAAETPSKQPNIVMILVDDLGWGDLACYGNPEALTPRLDTLAKEGQKFTNFRANCSVCSPIGYVFHA